MYIIFFFVFFFLFFFFKQKTAYEIAHGDWSSDVCSSDLTAVNQILEDQDEETMQRYAQLVPMFQEMGELHRILETMRDRKSVV